MFLSDILLKVVIPLWLAGDKTTKLESVMKYCFFPLLALILLAAISCSEKAPEVPAELIQPRINDLTTRLNLTAEQVQKITPIISDATGRLKAVMYGADENAGFNSHMGMRAAADSLHDAVAAILQPEQVAVMDSLHMRLMPSMTLIDLYDRLKLTPEQTTWIDSVEIAYRAKMAAMRQGQDRESIDREAMMKLREEYNRDIGELFTADQWEVYEQIQDERMQHMRERMQNGGRRGGGPGGAPGGE